MKVKVGDNVKVIAGKDKGKEGKILATFKAKNKVIVAGVNVIKKHQKPRYTNETGSIVEVEAPIHVSNVKLAVVNKETKVAKTTKTAKTEKVEEKVEKKATKKTTTKKASTSKKKES